MFNEPPSPSPEKLKSNSQKQKTTEKILLISNQLLNSSQIILSC